MSEDKQYVTEAEQRAAYDALGLDPALYGRTFSVLLEPSCVTVSRFTAEQIHIDPETGDPAFDVTVLYLATPVSELSR